MTQPSQPIPAGEQPPEPSKKPIDTSDSTTPAAPGETSSAPAAPASCPGCGQGHGEGASCPSCHAAQSEPSLEETGTETSGEPLVCVRYGRMSTLGLFRSKIGPVERGLRVVIKSDRGLEIGTALRSATRQLTYEGRPLKLVGTIRRIATHEELAEEKHLHQSEDRERKFCEEKMRERKLPMKLVAAEHLFGGDRIIFYFLSETRIDFRDLVRDLSHEFQTRIEMRQVGVRDEARLLADYERCGQFICCRAFIKEFQPVSMRMAKIQKATLDPSKISGRCGRLMCCLRYEQDTYDELRKNLPRKNSYVMTEHGPARVVGGDILTQLVRVEIAGKYEVAPLDAITARDLKEADVMAAWSKIGTGPGGPRSRSSSSEPRGRDSGRRPDRPVPPKPEVAPAAPFESAVAEAPVEGPEEKTTSEVEAAAVPASVAANAPAAPGAVPPGGVPPQGAVKKRRRRRRGGRDRRGPEGAPGQAQPAGQGPQVGGSGSQQQTNLPPAPAAQTPMAPRGPESVSSPRTGPDDLGLPRAVLESFGAFDASSAPPDDDGPDEGEAAGETGVSTGSSAQSRAGTSPSQAGTEAQRHHRRGRRGGRRRGGRHGQPGQPGQGSAPGQSGPPSQPGPAV